MEQAASSSRRPQSRRPLSRGSLESTLAELDGVCQGVDASRAWEPEPENPLRRPYWLLRLVRQTVRDGGFITPRLHVPALAWQMHGAALAGLSVKTKALESVLILFVDRVLPLQKPRGPEDMARACQALQVFEGVRAELDELQNQLARPFPFVAAVKTTTAAAATAGGAGSGGSSGGKAAGGGSGAAGAAEADGGGGLGQVQQRLSSLFSKTVKTVKKSVQTVNTAYERIGVAVASKISDEELVAYASLVHEVCDKAQSLDAWFVHLDGIRRSLQEHLRAAGNAGGGGDDRSGSGESMAFCQVAEQILLELLHCARFLQEVVVELLLRDISTLLEIYLRKMRKSFTRMIFELEEEDDD